MPERRDGQQHRGRVRLAVPNPVGVLGGAGDHAIRARRRARCADRRRCRNGTRRMIVIATIGATMTMPIAPRLLVLTATAAEQPMTSKQTSEPTINHAADEAGAAGAATRVAGTPAQLEHVAPSRRSAVPSLSLISCGRATTVPGASSV